jgi:sulfite exporter TauE/SafE
MCYAALMVGFLGSLHCVGMCGPIAFALPVRTTNKWIKFLKYMLYNLGRVFTYSCLGLMIGLLGKGFAMAGLQEFISIAAGFLILASVMLIHHPFKSFYSNKITSSIKEKLKNSFRIYFQKTGWLPLFILGILNGLLPCGMVYMAMLGALASGNTISGALFMAAFGLGTIPAILAISFVGSTLSTRLKSLFYKATPLIACIVGVLLIIRGLHLDVPYVSPGKSCCQTHACH